MDFGKNRGDIGGIQAFLLLELEFVGHGTRRPGHIYGFDITMNDDKHIYPSQFSCHRCSLLLEDH